MEDATTRRTLCNWLGGAGYQLAEHANGSTLLQDAPPAVACIDLELRSLAETLKYLQTRDPDLPVIILSAQRELEAAISTMPGGAYDFVARPLDRTVLLGAVARAAERRILSNNVRRLERELAKTRADLDQPSAEVGGNPDPLADVLDLRELERRAISRALKRAGGSMTRAAKLLGIGRATIYRKLAAYGLTGTDG